MLELRILYFEDLAVGMSESFSKAVSSSDVVGYAELTGDRNPIHLAQHFAAKTPFKTRIAHGLYTASLISAVLGTRLPGPGAIYISQTLNFRPGSSGRRNSCVRRSQQLVKGLGGRSPPERLSRPAVEGHRHGGKVLGAVHAEVGALWKVLAQQPVGVLVRAALPRAVRVAEVDRHASLDPELGVLGHLRSPIPRQRPSELLG